jgi:hypothetical protein
MRYPIFLRTDRDTAGRADLYSNAYFYMNDNEQLSYDWGHSMCGFSFVAARELKIPKVKGELVDYAGL